MKSAERVLRPGYVRVDERGTLCEVLNEGRWESVLCGEMHRDAVVGRHFHKVTHVFFYLTSGRATIVTVDVATSESARFALHAGEGVWLQPQVAHALRFEEESKFLMLKSHRYDPGAPDTFHYEVPL